MKGDRIAVAVLTFFIALWVFIIGAWIVAVIITNF